MTAKVNEASASGRPTVADATPIRAAYSLGSAALVGAGSCPATSAMVIELLAAYGLYAEADQEVTVTRRQLACLVYWIGRELSNDPTEPMPLAAVTEYMGRRLRDFVEGADVACRTDGGRGRYFYADVGSRRKDGDR